MKTAKSAKWSETYYVLTYKLALEGLSVGQIASTLGTSTFQFKAWMKSKPGLQFALYEGQQTHHRNLKGRHSFQDFIFGKLSSEAKRLWKELERAHKTDNPILRINRIFAKNGEDARKHLFVHAITRTHFNVSEACKKLAITRSQFQKWLEEDLSFSKLIEEVEFHKDNFLEGALMKLVLQGNTQAVMMANRTRNKDRGYGEHIDVKHSGSIQHNSVVDLTKLSEKLQMQILSEMREHEKQERIGLKEQ